MKIINQINNDADVKKLSLKEQKQLANEVRELILKTAETTPLHLSSNLGIVEITIALMNNFDLTKDKVLYDTGHQTYVHKILTGRRDQFHTIRQPNGITGFLNMDESIYDHYSPGHSGNILSVASGMYQSIKQNNKDPKKLKYYNNTNIVAVMGDAAFANGMAFEALNDIAYNKEPIIIVLNDNEMSISKAVGALSEHLSSLKTSNTYHNLEKGLRKVLDFNKLYYGIYNTNKWLENHLMTKNLFKNLGFNYIGPVDGNNLKKANKAISKAKWLAHQGPVIVHLRTKKGYGDKNAESDKLGDFHSYSKSSHNNSFGIEATNKVLSLMQNDDKIFVINPAMTRSSNCEIISEAFKDRYLDVGIAEEHALSKASGMALMGLKPIVYIYASFLQRAYDQLLHDNDRLKLPITLLIDRADTSGGDGPTHHGVYDVGFLKTLEHTTIVSPRNLKQLFQLIDLSQKNQQGIFAIRYPKWYFNEYHQLNEDYQIVPGKWEWFDKYHSKTLIISYGPYINKIIDEIGDKHHIDVVNAIYINQYDKHELQKVFKQYDKVIVYERIKTNNGLVADLYEYASTHGLKTKIIAMNYYLKDLGHGSTASLDKDTNMDIASIIKNL